MIVLTIICVHQNVVAVRNQIILIITSAAKFSAKKARATALMTMNVKARLFVVNGEAVAMAMAMTTST